MLWVPSKQGEGWQRGEGRVMEALSGSRHTGGQHALGSLIPGGGDRGAGVQTVLAEHGEVTVPEPFYCADLSA